MLVHAHIYQKLNKIKILFNLGEGFFKKKHQKPVLRPKGMFSLFRES